MADFPETTLSDTPLVVQSPAVAPVSDFPIAAAEALRAVKHGRSVLPIWGIDPEKPSPGGFACRCPLGASCKRPGKHPHIFKPYARATSSSDRVAEWAAKWPYANWAWMPGKSRHVVLDVDRRRAGDETLYMLESVTCPK